MDEVERQLVCETEGLIRLLTPPFDQTPHDPGYIKGYPPGIRENGGQYTHAALWIVSALAKLGRRDRIAALLRMLSPISHASTPEQVARYQLEPYVIAADVYGNPPHVGRGGWSWYTGSAGWMIRVTLEALLGLQIEGGEWMLLRPCIPDGWPGFSLSYRLPGEDTLYEVKVRKAGTSTIPVTRATLDGAACTVGEEGARIPLRHDGGTHHVQVELGGGGMEGPA
jgi:cyclic beta-1,2-glucan synthetase